MDNVLVENDKVTGYVEQCSQSLVAFSVAQQNMNKKNNLPFMQNIFYPTFIKCFLSIYFFKSGNHFIVFYLTVTNPLFRLTLALPLFCQIWAVNLTKHTTIGGERGQLWDYWPLLRKHISRFKKMLSINNLHNSLSYMYMCQ